MAAAQDPDVLLAASRETAGQLIQQLGAQLQAELAKAGPDVAVAVCKTIAPGLTGGISRATAWGVSRVRNPLLGEPDAWEQRVLEEFDWRAAAGDKADTLELGEVVQEPAGRYYRYMKAIPVQAPA
jgi:hypothetical protein